jgi:hypothetical protein
MQRLPWISIMQQCSDDFFFLFYKTMHLWLICWVVSTSLDLIHFKFKEKLFLTEVQREIWIEFSIFIYIQLLQNVFAGSQSRVYNVLLRKQLSKLLVYKHMLVMRFVSSLWGIDDWTMNAEKMFLFNKVGRKDLKFISRKNIYKECHNTSIT